MEGLRFLELHLSACAAALVRLCVWLALLTIIFAPLERLFALHPKKVFRKAVLTDVGYYVLNSLTPSLLLSLPLAVVAWFVNRSIPSVITSAAAAWPIWLRFLVALAVTDVGSYWGHRLSHEIPMLWRFHAIHHSAEEIDFLVNTRGHPVDVVFTRLCGLVPLYVLGLASPMQGTAGQLLPLLVFLFGTLWGFFIHANLRWRFGPLEWLVSTPAFHHWHHTNDGPAYLNKNYAALLPWVDRIFGTLYLPKTHPERYGIDQPLPPQLFEQLLHPFMIWRTEPPPVVRTTASLEQITTGNPHEPASVAYRRPKWFRLPD